MRKTLITVIMSICLLMQMQCITAFAATDAGSSSANFLKISVGARQAAMGEAFCAIADDANTLFWNAAGLAHIEKSEIGFTYNKWLNNINEQSFSYVYPTENYGAFGIGFIYMNTGNIIGRDNSGALTENISINGIAGLISYARELFHENILGGMTVKPISQRLADVSAVSLALDLAFLIKLEQFNIGLCMQNLGPGLKFIDERNRLPLNFKLGATYFVNETTTIAADINLPVDNRINVCFGVENMINDIITFRFGYTTRIEEGIGITAGFGISYSQFRVDYAFIPYAKLGSTHLLTLRYLIPSEKSSK